MNLLHDRRIPLILILLLFVIPLNIYVIGDWIGTGVQWALFRYQDTSYGTSIFTLIDDFEFITSGILTTKTVISISLWITGVVLLIIGFIAFVVIIAEEMDEQMHFLGLIVIASGILLLASCITQYGPLFSGPAGLSIPIGIPLTIVVGGLIYLQHGVWSERKDSDELKPGEY